MVYNGYYKVMSNIPKMGHLPTPDNWYPSYLKGPKAATQGLRPPRSPCAPAAYVVPPGVGLSMGVPPARWMGSWKIHPEMDDDRWLVVPPISGNLHI